MKFFIIGLIVGISLMIFLFLAGAMEEWYKDKRR